MEGERYFSLHEVEALIPVLTEIMEGIRSAHADAGTIRARLHADQQRIALSGGGVVDRQAWQGDRARLGVITAGLQKGLARIVELGGVPKDLDLGLVDFPHLRAGQVVNLCWKYGERSIGYWHGVDEGFAGRKPL